MQRSLIPSVQVGRRHVKAFSSFVYENITRQTMQVSREERWASRACLRPGGMLVQGALTRLARRASDVAAFEQGEYHLGTQHSAVEKGVSLMPARKRHSRHSIPHLEELEPRWVPATLVNSTTIAYRDVDGDHVQVVID